MAEMAQEQIQERNDVRAWAQAVSARLSTLVKSGNPLVSGPISASLRRAEKDNEIVGFKYNRASSYSFVPDKMQFGTAWSSFFNTNDYFLMMPMAEFRSAVGADPNDHLIRIDDARAIDAKINEITQNRLYVYLGVGGYNIRIIGYTDVKTAAWEKLSNGTLLSSVNMNVLNDGLNAL